MKKFIFSLLAVLACAFSFAAETVKIGDFYFSLSYPNATLLQDQSSGKTEYKAMQNVVIPGSFTYDAMNYTVNTIGTSAFEGCTDLRSVELPSSIKYINTDAFYGCEKLTDINLPEGLLSISQRAFYKCAMSSVTIPSTVTSMGNYVFNGCPALTSVTWNAVNCTSSFGTYEYAPFYYSRNIITSFTFGENIQTIPPYLCYGMSKITNLDVPNTVTSLGTYAFAYCTSLIDANIPNTLTTVPSCLFEGCSALPAIIIPATVKTIGSDAFYNCKALASVNIDEGLKAINQRAFFSCALTSVTIPSTVTSIGNSAFNGCSKLTSVTWNAINCTSSYSSYENAPFYGARGSITSFSFGENVQTIPPFLCYGMNNLTEIVVPNTVTSLGTYAFAYCTALTAANIPNTLTTVPQCLFEGCTALPAIIIPASVTTIGTDAFYNCTSLASVNLDEGLKSINTRAFRGCAMTSVTIPSTVTSVGSNAFSAMNNLTSVTWNAINCSSSYSTSDSAPFSGSQSKITSFTFGDQVQVIPPYLCYNMKQLKAIEFPETVTSIGEYAFCYCSGLTNIHLPNSITSLGRSSFGSCTALREANLPENIVTLPVSLFDGCTALPSIAIPASVKNINSYVFYNCTALQYIYNYALTPQSVTSGVFYNVDKTTCKLYVPEEAYELYAAKDIWKEFLNIIPVEPEIRFEDKYGQFAYLGHEADTLYKEQVLLHMPVAPTIEGFTFLKWEVLAGDFEDGIVLQAVYEKSGTTDVEQIVNSTSSNRKFIQRGNVYVLRDDRIFTISGQRVK